MRLAGKSNGERRQVAGRRCCGDEGCCAAGIDREVVLVLGFGLGMAVVLAGIGLVIVNARHLVERRPSAARLRRIAVPLQLATASLVVVLGIVLTSQALTQVL